MAAQRLTAIYDQKMAPAGITVNQFSLLHLVQVGGEPTLKELAAARGLDRSTLGRNIRVMEKQGLVTLKVGDDARTRRIYLTSKGTNAFKKAAPLWYAVQTELTDRIGSDARNQLKITLDQLTASPSAALASPTRKSP